MISQVEDQTTLVIMHQPLHKSGPTTTQMVDQPLHTQMMDQPLHR